MPVPIAQQVVVITGASSGIGRETAIRLARKRAAVVLAARNQQALETVAHAIRSLGGTVHVVPTDVSDPQQVERLAAEAVRVFGRIDTWVNDAAVSEYATFEQMTDDEFRRIVDVNLMGPVYGTRAALRHMRPRGIGTIINVGSVLSDRAVPLQSAYVATKHALKGFTDALRLELERDRTGITVTLILPASINTPLFDHARSHMSSEPRPIPPVYEPSVVADAIVYAAEHKVREIYAGGFGKFLSVLNKLSPRLVDWYMMQNARFFTQQQDESKANDQRDALDGPTGETGSSRGRWGTEAYSGSIYTKYVDPHPAVKGALAGAMVLGAAAALIGIGRVTKRSTEPRRTRGLRDSIRRIFSDNQPRPVKLESSAEALTRDAYVPVLRALLRAGIEPRQVPGFDRLHASFLDRVRIAAATEKARYELAAENSHPARPEPLGRTFRRFGSRLAEAFRSA